MTQYDIGDLARLSASIAVEDLDSQTPETFVPTDPSTLKFYLKLPDGDLLTSTYGEDPEGDAPAILRDDVGEYRVEYKTTQPGYHEYRFEADGDVIEAEEDCFKVLKSRF